jgi:hypothetical protein
MCDFDVRNHLISLHAKLLKLPFLDFFDSLYYYLQKLKHQLKYRYHIYPVSGQVNLNFNFCQIISAYRQLNHIMAIY